MRGRARHRSVSVCAVAVDIDALICVAGLRCVTGRCDVPLNGKPSNAHYAGGQSPRGISRFGPRRCDHPEISIRSRPSHDHNCVAAPFSFELKLYRLTSRRRRSKIWRRCKHIDHIIWKSAKLRANHRYLLLEKRQNIIPVPEFGEGLCEFVFGFHSFLISIIRAEVTNEKSPIKRDDDVPPIHPKSGPSGSL